MKTIWSVAFKKDSDCRYRERGGEGGGRDLQVCFCSQEKYQVERCHKGVLWAMPQWNHLTNELRAWITFHITSVFFASLRFVQRILRRILDLKNVPKPPGISFTDVLSLRTTEVFFRVPQMVLLWQPRREPLLAPLFRRVCVVLCVSWISVNWAGRFIKLGWWRTGLQEWDGIGEDQAECIKEMSKERISMYFIFAEWFIYFVI